MSVPRKLPPSPQLKNIATAPIIFFDNAPLLGAFAGVIEAELSARVLAPQPDGSVKAEAVCVGHLRCSPQAAQSLIDALQKALDLATKHVHVAEDERAHLDA